MSSDIDIWRLVGDVPPGSVETDAAWKALGNVYWCSSDAEQMYRLLLKWGWFRPEIEAFAMAEVERLAENNNARLREVHEFELFGLLGRLFDICQFSDCSPVTLSALEMFVMPVTEWEPHRDRLARAILASRAITESTLALIVRLGSMLSVVDAALRHPNTTTDVARAALEIEHSQDIIAQRVLEWGPAWDDADLLRATMWYHGDSEPPSARRYTKRVRETLDRASPGDVPALLLAYSVFGVERAVNYLRRMPKRRLRQVPARAWGAILSHPPTEMQLAPLRAATIFAMDATGPTGHQA